MAQILQARLVICLVQELANNGSYHRSLPKGPVLPTFSRLIMRDETCSIQAIEGRNFMHWLRLRGSAFG